MLISFVTLLAGCGEERHELRVVNQNPFPVEVWEQSAGGRLSRQADLLGVVGPNTSISFKAGHAFVGPTVYLSVNTKDGRTLMEVRKDRPAPGYQSATINGNAVETLTVGP